MKPRAIYVGGLEAIEEVYPADIRRGISRLVEVLGPPRTPESVEVNPSQLADAQIILGTWTLPRLDANLLAHAPRLEAVFYGAGTVRPFVTEAMWDRGIRLFTGVWANAVPVADFTLAAILWSLKRGWSASDAMRAGEPPPARSSVPGINDSTVGLVGMTTIARALRWRLRGFQVKVVAQHHKPSSELARELAVKFMSMDEVFRVSDVVSLHSPLLDSTRGMVTGRHFELMKPGSTFINTARGAIVRENEMIDVLTRRPDIQAVLDVTDPDPPALDSPLRTLPNVVLTPHIAGAIGRERRILGSAMLEELNRYLRGEMPRWELSRERASMMA
ncbi:MAG TPA: hydroxyacid dehydrogenase [Candidatus Dormibacteraeota bacterium]|jgi:phosphoglycerate dehydrogenase-like enzyme|nr:hydroxyacid dehydrogenase [Candidatus Dormibacteraeota bacterium]